MAKIRYNYGLLYIRCFVFIINKFYSFGNQKTKFFMEVLKCRQKMLLKVYMSLF